MIKIKINPLWINPCVPFSVVFCRFLKEEYLYLISFIILVGNIPYEATEEKLKDIFSEVGPVISLK